MKISAADQFLRSKPAVYLGFDGNLYVATYANGEKNGYGIGSLEIKNAAGEVVRDILCCEDKARTFFWNLDTPETQK